MEGTSKWGGLPEGEYQVQIIILSFVPYNKLIDCELDAE